MRVNWREQCAEMQTLLDGQEEDIKKFKARVFKEEQYKAENDQLKGEIRQLLADKSNLAQSIDGYKRTIEQDRMESMALRVETGTLWNVIDKVVDKLAERE